MFETYRHRTPEEADETLNHLLDVIAEGTWDWHGATGRVERSPGWYRMLGYDVGIFRQDVFTWENLIHPDDYPRVMNRIEGFINGALETYCIEYRCKQADGQYLWILDRAKIIERNPDGSAARIIGAHQDIHRQKTLHEELSEKDRLLKAGNMTLENLLKQKTVELETKNRELEEKIREIEYISNTDRLTGIPNRKKFEETIGKEISRAKRYGHPLSLAILDLDLFKQINDTHGHDTGDQVLRQIADLIRNHLRSVDFFARWGGEEFTIIFPDLNLESAVHASEKLRYLIEQLEIDRNLSVTSSFGLSQFDGQDSFEELLQRADKALYRAKKLGRNRVESLERVPPPPSPQPVPAGPPLSPAPGLSD